MMRLYRVIMPVGELQPAVQFYSTLLGQPGTPVSGGRHYFSCGDVTLAVYCPAGDGDKGDPRPKVDYVYFAVDNLEEIHRRAEQLGGLSTTRGDGQLPMGQIATRPWGERSFYTQDPFGNPLCFVDSTTLFTGKPR